MARLKMRVRRALPYEPQAKPIESFFRTLHKRFDAKLAPYYCGPSPERRPEECSLIIKEHDQYLAGKIEQSPLLPASEFIAWRRCGWSRITTPSSNIPATAWTAARRTRSSTSCFPKLRGSAAIRRSSRRCSGSARSACCAKAAA
jgi:hypothetical protein